MMRKKVILIFTLSLCGFLLPQSSAANETKVWTVAELMQSLGGGKKYQNADGSYVSISMHFYTPSFEYKAISYDPVTGKQTDYDPGWARTNMTVNGVYVPGSSATQSDNYQTFDFDENGRLQAVYASKSWGNTGQLLQTYQYATDGQMLVYNTQGELIGAYNNWVDKRVDATHVYEQPLNHLDENGNYSAKDENGNVVEVYKKNGGFNSYQYDAGGNLIRAYEDGVETFRRRIYTPSEATAAVSKKGNNTFSIRYR